MSAPIGHNNPPSALSSKTKLERIRYLLERSDLTAAQKCVGIGIVVTADREWVSEAKTADLMRMASAKDRDTVFRATKALGDKDIGIIEKAMTRGQSGKFRVLPPRIVEAVIEAFDELQSSRVEPDRGKNDPVGSNPSGHTEVVGFNPTSASRALIESPSEIVKLKQEVNTPLPPEPPPENPAAADARSAFEIYNEVAARCNLPRAEKLTSDRQRKIIARLKDYGLDGWNRALGNIEKSAFLTGQTHHGFRADLDFVCQAKSFGKLHDGGYGNGRHAQPPPAVRAQNEVLIDEAFSKAWEADKPREPYR